MSSIPVSDLVLRVQETGAKRVALQFPDGLRRRSFEVASALHRAGLKVIISGDPCYGACDLALDALSQADLLVHFGHTPVENVENVIYEHLEEDFDLTSLDAAAALLRGPKVGLVTTVQHVHMLEAVAGYLGKKGFECVVERGSPRTPFPGQVLGCSFEAARQTGADEILFVGTGLFHPLGVRLATGARVIALDPYTGTAGEVDADRLLRKRYARIEKARDAESIGIILSLKSGQMRREMAEKLAGLSQNAYVITLREVTPDSLMNLGFDCYVNTACPRLAYDDQVRFPAPLLSPQEFEIACGVRSWEDYEIDEIS